MPKSSADTIYNRFNSYKVLVYSDRLEQIANNKLPYPVIWHIYPTNKCCHDCKFCIMKSEHGDKELPWDTMQKAIKDAEKYGAKAIHFSGGGEPLMNPHTLKALQMCKDLELKTALSTNGALLKPDIYNLVDYPRVSINAGTKETHEKIMQAKTWDAIWANLMALDDRRKLGLAFIITKDNWHEIYQFCELADRIGAGFVHIRPVYDPSNDIKDLLPAIDIQVEKARKHFDIDIFYSTSKFNGYWNERKYTKCRATPMNVVLKANGRFIPCQDRLDLEFGDYNKEPFEKIWNSEEHKQLIAGINLDVCPRCVMTNVNEIIQHFYIDNSVITELI